MIGCQLNIIERLTVNVPTCLHLMRSSLVCSRSTCHVSTMRGPTTEDAVTRHVWSNKVIQKTRSIAASEVTVSHQSQIECLIVVETGVVRTTRAHYL